MQAEADYSFPPLTRSDYARMRGWLDQPHVRAWWGDPDTEIALIDAEIDGDTADLRLVAYQGRPFAYVQDYPAHHDPMPQYAEFPPGTRAMDTFLGEPDMLGQGHAARYLNLRAADLRRRYPAVVIDPDPSNERAVRAYRRAGFRAIRTTTGETGKPVLVMAFDPTFPSLW